MKLESRPAVRVLEMALSAVLKIFALGMAAAFLGGVGYCLFQIALTSGFLVAGAMGLVVGNFLYHSYKAINVGNLRDRDEKNTVM